MIKHTMTLAAAALLGVGSVAQAQNGSDVTGPPPTTTSGGAFVPLPTTVAGGSGGTVSSAVVAAVQSAQSGVTSNFTAASPSVTSPVTGQSILPAAASTIGTLITSGSNSASVTSTLTAGGAPAAQVTALVQAMAGLANGGSPAAIAAAAQAFNALIQNAPPSLLANPPAEMLAIHAALLPMANAIGAR